MAKTLSKKWNLAKINPKLAKEWHPTKNGKLTPKDVAPASHVIVWWRCKKYKEDEWRAVIKDRHTNSSRNDRKGSGCPYCVNQKVNKRNCLATLNPKLAREWHPTKNKPLTPKDVVPGSSQKVWWKCKKGHEWEATCSNRTVNHTGCGICNPEISKIQIRIYCELCHIFPNTKLEKKIKNVRIDILIPSIKMAVEYDGYYYHGIRENKLIIDKGKTKKIKKLGYDVIRIREGLLKKTAKADIHIKKNENPKKVIDSLLKQIVKTVKIEHKTRQKIKKYLETNEYRNPKKYLTLIKQLPGPLEQMSLATLNPEIAKEWHPTKNKPLTPKDVVPGSNQKVWWKCKKGHEWEAQIWNRNNGSGCLYCVHKLPSKEYNLANNPKLAKEWHPTKNGKLTPKDVVPGSHKIVWWKCKKDHIWKAQIKSRHIGGRKKIGVGCPYCARHFPSKEYNLAKSNPKLAKEWHPTKNGKLTPKDVVPGSHQKVWWKCKKGHAWEAEIKSRQGTKNQKGYGCKQCYLERIKKSK